MTAIRVVPHPALYKAAVVIVEARFEAGDFEAQYLAQYVRFAHMVPARYREAMAREEVVGALAKDLADVLEGAVQDWFVDLAIENHLKVGGS